MLEGKCAFTINYKIVLKRFAVTYCEYMRVQSPLIYNLITNLNIFIARLYAMWQYSYFLISL